MNVKTANYLAALLCLCLLLLCGCGAEPGASSAESGREPGSAATMEKPDAETDTPETEAAPRRPADPREDPEIKAALDARENKRFWRIEAPGSFPEGVSLWSFSEVNTASLWTELRNSLQIDARDVPEQKTPDSVVRCRFLYKGKAAEARISRYSIEISFFNAELAEDFAELLLEEEAARLGLPMEDRPEERDHNEALAAAPDLDGLPLDSHYGAVIGSLSAGGVRRRGKNVNLFFPIREISAFQQLSADSLLPLEEIRETLMFLDAVNASPGPNTVTVYQSCDPVYYADARTGTIRPAWCVGGVQYTFWSDTAGCQTDRLELLIDAVTGEVRAYD